jgi:hypothetical protein
MDTDSELTEEGCFISEMIQGMMLVISVGRAFVDARSAALVELVHATHQASRRCASPTAFADLKAFVVNRTREIADSKLARLADEHMIHASVVRQMLETMLEAENQ